MEPAYPGTGLVAELGTSPRTADGELFRHEPRRLALAGPLIRGAIRPLPATVLIDVDVLRRDALAQHALGGLGRGQRDAKGCPHAIAAAAATTHAVLQRVLTAVRREASRIHEILRAS